MSASTGPDAGLPCAWDCAQMVPAALARSATVTTPQPFLPMTFLEPAPALFMTTAVNSTARASGSYYW
jgi:hypothetical protein